MITDRLVGHTVVFLGYFTTILLMWTGRTLAVSGKIKKNKKIKKEEEERRKKQHEKMSNHLYLLLLLLL